MTFWPDAIHLVALLRGDGCVQECLCADAASAIEGYEAKIESDAKVIAALREALKKCATKLERCAIAGGTTPEYAALVVEEFRAFEQTAGEK